jgi:hypothetical protein
MRETWTAISVADNWSKGLTSSSLPADEELMTTIPDEEELLPDVETTKPIAAIKITTFIASNPYRMKRLRERFIVRFIARRYESVT